MLDRSSKLDDSLMDAYRSIHEIHKGHAAGESDIEKQASQLASDIRYKAKGRLRDGMNAEDKKRIYLKLLAASPAPGIVKNKAKRKLLGESVLINEIVPAGNTKMEQDANRKKVVRGGINVAKRVAKGVAGIAKREGTLSQKVTGAAIDAVKDRVGGATKKVSSYSKSPSKHPDKEGDKSHKGTTSWIGRHPDRRRASDLQQKKGTGEYASKAERKASFKARVAKQRAAGVSMRGENFSDWRNELIGEEGYDHWRDKHLERGGIGAVASKSPSKPYTRSPKQPKGDTAYQKEMKAKHGGKLPSALDVVKSKIEKEHGKGAIMKNEETSAADKIINNIRSQRVDEGKLVHGPFGPYITGQKMPKEQREVPLRKVPYEDINSAKKVVGESKNTKKKKTDRTKEDIAIEKKLGLPKRSDGSHLPKQYREVVEDAKMGRQSDEKLSSLQKQFSGMDQSTPSNQHMLKRVNREINRRKKQKTVGEEVTNEAKIDKVKHGDHNLYDNPGKEKDRNERKFGKQSFNQKGQTQLRRGLHWSKRGDKKVKGAKVEEEVGVSSSAAILKARQEAELKAKEEAAVKKAKKAKNEEVALENRMTAYTAGMSDAQKDAATSKVSQRTIDSAGRRNDAAAFKSRKTGGKANRKYEKEIRKSIPSDKPNRNKTGRGQPVQYRKSADSPESEARFPYGRSKIVQGKGSIKDLKNEYSPAVEKVIESIKINKASPKSPNCIIMPKKDDIADKAGGNGKKSTKNVVSKKQKQFFNQEGKTYSSFITEVVKALTQAAASQAAKGAITTTAKTVGKETVKKTGSAVAKQTGGAIVKSGGSAVAKQTGGAIVKKGGGSIVKSGGGKLTTKGGALAKVKKGGKEIVKQGSSQLAVNKAGELANRDKSGALTKQEPQKQGNQSKGFNMPKIKKVDTIAHTITTKNQQ